MRNLIKTIWRGIGNQAGATAVEYGLVAGLIAVALIAAIAATGGSTEAMWDYVAQQYKGASTP